MDFFNGIQDIFWNVFVRRSPFGLSSELHFVEFQMIRISEVIGQFKATPKVSSSLQDGCVGRDSGGWDEVKTPVQDGILSWGEFHTRKIHDGITQWWVRVIVSLGVS